MYRVRDIIGSVDYDELLKLRKDLEHGGVHLKKLVNMQIKEHEKTHDKVCSNCQTPIEPYSTSTYTLMFGPDDFKKKATFCAMDCMEFFIQKLKRIKEEGNKHQKPESPAVE